MRYLGIGLILGMIGGIKLMWTQLNKKMTTLNIQKLLNALEKVRHNMKMSIKLEAI
ncbi:hypothetical protein CRENPOLYSF1_610009 [Crenothrix polyspora]|uniref:Uncharacterized protein n=1 Tax=Crenothrix polyspora TaxID=360316 RepID=A0A1R4HFE8_9GAMM|nr:hypothetical protein CRENPOLYSF1_610009 [Crenothrix polyspora]